MKAILAATMAIVTFVTLALATTASNYSNVVAQNSTQSQPTVTSSTVSGGFANIQTVQDEKHIIITVTKSGEPTQGPIIVVPPTQQGKNGTIITPGDNSSKTNVTNPTNNNTQNGNVTVIDQKGNVTEVPGGNVTQVNNQTVVIAPSGQNVTETPGNVTIIAPDNQTVTTTKGNVTVVDPPAVITPPMPTCTCQNQNQNQNQQQQSNNTSNTNNATQPVNKPPFIPQPSNNSTNSTG